MDTVHKEKCTDICSVGDKISSKQGIGGDDRCGIFIIMNLIRSLKCSVLLCEDEEKGGIGANKFAKTEYVNSLDVNYMIEFDRKNSNDAVFYNCANKDFINFVCDATGFKEAVGSFSDISIIAPKSKICAVNLSCGYYNAHTTYEYVKYDEMMDTIEAAKALIKSECEKPFEYVAKKYSPAASTYKLTDWGDYYDNFPSYKNKSTTNGFYSNAVIDRAKKDKSIELEVLIINERNEEDTICTYGNTKDECWFNFFSENPHLCFNDVVDYSFF
jgi:hypothetical protein